MGIREITALMVLTLAVTVGGVSCRGEPDREAISIEVAEGWVQDNNHVVFDLMVELLFLSPAMPDQLYDMPDGYVLLEGLVADQWSEKVGWRYSAPTSDSKALYRVTATAFLEMVIDLPIIGARPYTVTLAFYLVVDTDNRVVEAWWDGFEDAVVTDH